MADEAKVVKRAEKEVSKRYECKVYRLNVERENAELPISVNVIGKKKREFTPGEKVVLHDYHIGVLRNAVDSTQIEVPSESGVYKSANPIAEAERNFPGFKAIRNSIDGTILLSKEVPLYSVEILREV